MAARVRWREDRKAWFLFVYNNGTQAAERFGPSAADKRRAERRAKEIDREIRNGRLGLIRREKPVPFDSFAYRWLEQKVKLPAERGLEGAVAPKTAAIRSGIVRLHLVPFLRGRNLRSLDPAAVDELEAHLIGKKIKTGRLSGRTIGMILGTLRLILAHAQTRGIVASNSVDTWKAALPSRGRRRTSSPKIQVTKEMVLETDEREKFLETFATRATHYYPLVLFLAETGCRISESFSLTWDDVNLVRGEARLYRQKTGHHDYVELSERLLAVLRSLVPDLCPDGLLVFRTPRGNPIRYPNFSRRVWDPLMMDFSPARRITPHMLRHTWASLHMARGTPIEWIRRMGGWSSSRMLLDRYSHFMPREMRGFSNALRAADRTTPNQAQTGKNPEAETES